MNWYIVEHGIDTASLKCKVNYNNNFFQYLEY